MTFGLPAPTTLAMTFFMSQGARNWPFLMLMARPVAAAASSRSVWRDRKAGICSTSTASATGAHCASEWTSVRVGRPVTALISAKIGRASARPMPRAAVAEVRFALSKLVL